MSQGLNAGAMEIELAPLDLEPRKRPGEDEDAWNTLLGKRNRILIGAPRCTDYVAEALATGSLPADVERRVRDGRDFRRVRPSITLLPDRGCAFVSVELSLELLAEARDGTGPVSERPVVYDVQPREILREVPYTESTRRGYEVGGEAGAGAAKLTTKRTSETTIERNGTLYVRERYGYGLNYSEVGWRLGCAVVGDLGGDVHDLEFIAEVPPRASLAGRFHVIAEIAVEARVDRWLTRVFGPRRDGAPLDVVYSLDG